MFEEMEPSAFPEFLAAFWTEKGWDTSVTENDDGTYMVAGDRDNGTRGLIGVRPGEGTEIDGGEVEDFAAFCERKGVDVRVMATRGRFTTGARSAADAADVHLLDPNELASSVRDEGAEHLVEEHLDGDGGSLFGVLPSLPVPSGLSSGVPVVPILAAAVVIAAAVFVGPTLLGMVPLPDVGGGGGGSGGTGGPTVTALSLADANDTAATVRWDVRTGDRVANYSAPDGQTFVVVGFEAESDGAAATLRPGNFVLAVNGTNRPVQEFANMSDAFRARQLPKRVAANGSASGVIVFLAPEDFDGATLVETYDGPGLRLERAELEFNVE